jgi:predicted ArsR family transcriptional regulator
LLNAIRETSYEVVVEAARPVGRNEAAAAAGIGRALAAYHLDRLVAAGLLESGYGRPHGNAGAGIGRPAKLYRRGGGRSVSTCRPGSTTCSRRCSCGLRTRSDRSPEAARRPELVCGLNLALIEGMLRGLGGDARAALEPQDGRCCVAIRIPR